MILISKTYWGGVPFRFAKPPRDAALDARVLRTPDFRDLRAMYWTPRSQPRPRTAVVVMHPRVDFTSHYTIPGLVAAGLGVLGAASRCVDNDLDVVHEDLVLDLAACVRWLREHRGAERVVLLGNSGGGSLAALYQAQATAPPEQRLAHTPGGSPTKLPHATLVPADALVLLSAHRGQARILEHCIDPAVTDEANPLTSDASLDMYDPRNGFREPPAWSHYDDAFVARFRAAQRARIARLDAIAHALCGAQREAAEAAGAPGFAALPPEEQRRLQRRGAFEAVLTVYRTMANLHYVDPHLDPSPRDYGSLLSERPDLMNYARLGFARVCTPGAWLSTWSIHHSRADLTTSLTTLTLPILMIHAGRDREIYPQSDAEPTWQAITAADRTRLDFAEARHYFEPDHPGQPEPPVRSAMVGALADWIRERFATS